MSPAQAVMVVGHALNGPLISYFKDNHDDTATAVAKTQHIVSEIFGALKSSVDESKPNDRQIVFYYSVTSSHTHIQCYTGGDEGQRGGAGNLTMTNDEWKNFQFVLEIISVLLPGVVSITDLTVKGIT